MGIEIGWSRKVGNSQSTQGQESCTKRSGLFNGFVDTEKF